jgi:hypothetical protein
LPSKPGVIKELTVFYGGKPKVAVNPPWDGELLGKKTAMETIYSVFLSGLGAGVWPNIICTTRWKACDQCKCSGNLINVSNGRLISVKK